MITDIFKIAGYFLQILIGFHLVFPIIILFIYIIRRGFTTKISTQPQQNKEADYAIIVTAYEQTHTLPPVIDSILQLNYSNYLIYIVADKCDVTNLHFESDKVIILRPPQTLASNTRSHFYAINNFKRNHERLTIIDSDNLVDSNYLNELNTYFNAGFKAVQGERKAKNLDTTYACIDAARDIYYHFYDGEILFEAGSSATLAGSGMAFTVQLYKDCLGHLDITGAGFDKVLQNAIVSRKERIAFTKKAIVYDEKTSQSDQLVKQRARWINTWFKYNKFGFGLLAKGLANLNLNQWLFGLVLLRPPLFLFLLAGVLLTMVNLFINPTLFYIWLAGFLCFVLGFILAVFRKDTDPKIIQSLWGIPKFVFYQVLSLLKARKANQYSVATQHFHGKKLDEIKKP
ncbi:MAG: glycosyltransferase [Chitinophagaceae bacterium]